MATSHSPASCSHSMAAIAARSAPISVISTHNESTLAALGLFLPEHYTVTPSLVQFLQNRAVFDHSPDPSTRLEVMLFDPLVAILSFVIYESHQARASTPPCSSPAPIADVCEEGQGVNPISAPSDVGATPIPVPFAEDFVCEDNSEIDSETPAPSPTEQKAPRKGEPSFENPVDIGSSDSEDNVPLIFQRLRKRPVPPTTEDITPLQTLPPLRHKTRSIGPAPSCSLPPKPVPSTKRPPSQPTPPAPKHKNTSPSTPPAAEGSVPST